MTALRLLVTGVGLLLPALLVLVPGPWSEPTAAPEPAVEHVG